MRKSLKLEKYGISKEEYLQLKYLCLSYDAMREKLEDCRSIKAKKLDGMPRGRGISDPTARDGEKGARLAKDIADIEQAAIEAAPETYRYLLRHVTKDIPYESLGVPQGRRQFYESRVRFFINLAKRKSIT